MNDRANFYYDPARQGYDTSLWKSITGVPTSVGTALRFNEQKAIGYGDIFKGDVTLAVTPLTVPNAFLTGGNGATAVVATWAAVASGEFSITIDGNAYDIKKIDFTGVASMDAVASKIQAAIRNKTGGLETCVWVSDHFVITSVLSITNTSAVAGGVDVDISGAGATAFMDSDVGNGVITTPSDREFGLEQINNGSKLTFKFYAGVFSCESSFNGVSKSTVVPWQSIWTAAKSLYTIKWTGFSAEFLINGVQVAFLTDASVPKIPLSVSIRNTTADNLDVAYIEVLNTQNYL